MTRMKHLYTSLIRFAQGKGFALLTVLCVGVITTTALWTRHEPVAPAVHATPPAVERPASVQMQQSLLAAVTPSPLPTQQPLLWRAPLEELDVIRVFSGTDMLRSGTTGLWTVHHAIDLSDDAGAPVSAMADGRVLRCDDNGSWIVLAHTGGYESCYSSLSLLGPYRTGDPVRAGQIIGFVGNTIPDEADLGPHLHLQVLANGSAIDPLELLE